jgi:alpha-tubulin suppressor-like RCC1 family protein
LKKAEKQPLVSNYTNPKEISSNFNIARSDKIMKFALGRDHYVVLTKLGKVFSWGR